VGLDRGYPPARAQAENCGGSGILVDYWVHVGVGLGGERRAQETVKNYLAG
jgi:hypothetical protein